MSKPSRSHKNPLWLSAGSTPFRTMIPHSAEWFETLLELDTVQAMMTGAVLVRKGRIDVCSICGDTPAPIYDLTDELFLPIRLCDNCRLVRLHLFGERYERRLPVDQGT